MEPTFSIAEISDKSGLSYDTIRYYVKIGLLPPTKRKENGQREYGTVHLERLVFISHLKRTGMPLIEIKHYMSLASAKNYESCYDLLYKHKHEIESKMMEIKATLEVVNYKLDHFKDLMKKARLGGE
ncbi:MerR family transcriptional regulator [Paenibacillus lignilyticus]|uniref:MerR family transcriptional regulator n=1 Tax=Paenibacillus lignilyticus TaxID=1172615 RepID=A0ABS5CAD1_9BACL|nr:MerR family transcriptional regulator [Paenibacillus lignilyticus]MBP3962954.1 MerR family transcriptional regulator [Paenibacillus lignilyticus]